MLGSIGIAAIRIFLIGVDYCSVIRCDGRILQIGFRAAFAIVASVDFVSLGHRLGILFHLGIRVATLAMDTQTSLLAAFRLKEG